MYRRRNVWVTIGVVIWKRRIKFTTKLFHTKIAFLTKCEIRFDRAQNISQILAFFLLRIVDVAGRDYDRQHFLCLGKITVVKQRTLRKEDKGWFSERQGQVMSCLSELRHSSHWLLIILGSHPRTELVLWWSDPYIMQDGVTKPMLINP